MSDDWNTVTKIGSKTRGSGATQREAVVKGKAALNAAQRNGTIVATEKKFATGNTKANLEGQRDRKIDDANDVVPVTKVDPEVAKQIAQKRLTLKNHKGNTMKQEDLAGKCHLKAADIAALEDTSGKSKLNKQHLTMVKRALGML